MGCLHAQQQPYTSCPMAPSPPRLTSPTLLHLRRYMLVLLSNQGVPSLARIVSNLPPV